MNPVRPPWPRGQPDVLGYSLRDYGNRVGIWRLFEVLDRHRLRGSVSLNVALCEHHPEIIEACRVRGWEFFSHGIYNTRYLYGMDEAQARGHRRRRPDGLAAHGPAHRGLALASPVPHERTTGSSPSAASSTRATSSTTTSRSR